MILWLLGLYFLGFAFQFPIILNVLLVATIGLLWYWRDLTRSHAKEKGLKEIPGPIGLPFLGNALQMGHHPEKQFGKWADEYGDIYRVWLGKDMMIVISDPKMSKEILSNDPAFTGRQHFPGLTIYDEKELTYGIINSEGELWEVHRRFLLRHLRDFGFGKSSSMEPLILEEVEEIIQRYKKQCGKPVDKIRETLLLAVVNSIWKIMSSQRFDHDDPVLRKLTTNTTTAFNDLLASSSMLIFFPWLRHIIPEWSGYKKVRAVFDENRNFFEKTVADHKKNFQEDDLKDFIDVYLAEMKKTTDPKSVFYGEIAEKQLVATLFDVFLAGSETTAMTTSWAILFLCTFPDVQKKLQEEILEVTGNNRRVSVVDKPNMPYAQALIDEVFRFSSIVPAGVPHRALAEREFRGYLIPKNAVIQPNMMHFHFNAKYFPEPEKFRPERFLSPDGKKYIRNENLQPFQVGRRVCVGESLARDSAFLYIINLFQQFSIEFDPKSPPNPEFEAEIGFLRAPLPYSVIMTDRLKHN